jgi:hypothetical protein
MLLFTIERTEKPIIGLPEDLLEQWDVKEGQEVALDDLVHRPRKATPEAIEAFMSLVGIFADAPEFEEYILEHRKEWDEWGRQLEESVLTQDS